MFRVSRQGQGINGSAELPASAPRLLGRTDIMKRTPQRYRLVLLALAVTLAGGLIVSSEGQEKSPLQRYMRQKLDHSKNVLEGLAVEDFAMIAKNAKAMRELSEDARWRVSPNVNYLRLSAEFQDLADELAAKAKERNLDGATLVYVKLTMNCVKCHQLVREQRLVTLGPGETDQGRR
jgi:Na+-transporting NADH:ubiquinone oxidoreductase subunit NqrC